MPRRNSSSAGFARAGRWCLPDVGGPEQEAILADSVGLALLVVLDRLAPAERVAFVLHDMFGVPFEEIAGITGMLIRRRPAAREPGRRRGARRGRAGRRAPGQPGERTGRRPAAGPAASRRRGVHRRLPGRRPRRAAGRARPGRRPARGRGRGAVGPARRSCGARRRRQPGAAVRSAVKEFGSRSSWTGCPASCTRRAARSRSCSPSATATTAILGIEVIADAGRLDALELAVLDPSLGLG